MERAHCCENSKHRSTFCVSPRLAHYDPFILQVPTDRDQYIIYLRLSQSGKSKVKDKSCFDGQSLMSNVVVVFPESRLYTQTQKQRKNCKLITNFISI